tara:strand:+ start:6260 stop:6871 length:612 start_codon:yes stop_codon:yes gene_type:complete
METLKNYMILILAFMALNISTAQNIENIDKIAAFHEGLAAVKQGDRWGFINEAGTMVIDFRTDVYIPHNGHPKFSDGYCLIFEKKEGITFFGYINTKGEVVIKPEYLAATSFENGLAQVIKHYVTETGNTNALGKKIVKHTYNELVIDKYNKTVQHIRGPVNFLLEKNALQKNSPRILSTFIAPKLIALHTNNDTFTIIKLKD